MGRIYRVPGADGLTVPIAAAATGGTVSPGAAVVNFLFPRAEFVTGLLLVPRPTAGVTLEAQAAMLSLAVVDEQINALVSDSRGSATTSAAGVAGLQVAGEGLLLGGFAWRPFPLQRPVLPGDRWSFTIQNRDSTAARVVTALMLFTDEAKR